jgi:hypothetical protein
MVAANPCAIGPKLWLDLRGNAFLATGCAEHNMLMILCIGVGQGVSRLQRSAFYYSRFPALPGWATAVAAPTALVIRKKKAGKVSRGYS